MSCATSATRNDFCDVAEKSKLKIVKQTSNGVHVSWDTGQTRLFNIHWLYRNRPETILKCGQMTTSSVAQPSPSTLMASICRQTSTLKLDWGSGISPSYFSSGWLLQFAQPQIMSNEGAQKMIPTPLRARAGMSDIARFSFSRLSTPKGILEWLEIIARDGLCIVEGVPLEPRTVLRLAEYIAPAMRTIYGEVAVCHNCMSSII
jgi:hypothetical protein